MLTGFGAKGRMVRLTVNHCCEGWDLESDKRLQARCRFLSRFNICLTRLNSARQSREGGVWPLERRFIASQVGWEI